MNKRTFIIGLVCLYIFTLAVYWLRLGGQHYDILSNTLYLFFPFIAMVSAVYTARLYGSRGPSAVVFIALALGFVGWFLGEFLYFSYSYIFHIQPYPSLADVFFVIAYPLFFVGLTTEVRQVDSSHLSLNKGVIALIWFVFFLLAGVVLYYGVFGSYDPHQPFLVNFIKISYGVGDLFIVASGLFTLVVAEVYKGGKLSLPWFYFLIGFMAVLGADILYAHYSTEYDSNVYLYKNIIDSLFMLGYALMAYALYEFGTIVKFAQDKLEEFKEREKDKQLREKIAQQNLP